VQYPWFSPVDPVDKRWQRTMRCPFAIVALLPRRRTLRARS
jgi:hypothetical protein